MFNCHVMQSLTEVLNGKLGIATHIRIWLCFGVCLPYFHIWDEFMDST